MLNRFLSLILLIGVTQGVTAETIVLKDKASVTGKILTQKKEGVAVDLGFTVLMIPRNQISKILDSEPLIEVKATRKPLSPADVQPVVAPITDNLPPAFFSVAKT